MSARETEQPVVWLESLIDRLNDISVSQIPHANFAVVDALDAITDEMRERLGAAAPDVPDAPVVDENRVRLQRVVGLLARWRAEVRAYRGIIQNLGPGHEAVDDYARPANCVESCANDLESELAGKEPND